MSAAPPRTADAARPTVLAPEPATLWIRYAPRGWPAPPAPWLDLARGGLGAVGEGSGAAALPEMLGGPFDDVVWLPPVAEELRGERDRLAEALLAAGTPVLVQAFPGEAVGAAGAAVVYDLTAVVLAAAAVGAGSQNPAPLDEGSGGRMHGGEPGAAASVLGPTEAAPAAPPEVASSAPRVAPGQPAVSPLGGLFSAEPIAAAARHYLSRLSLLPRGAAAVWPLIPGLTDAPALVAAGLDALAAAGAAVVQPVVPRLAAAERRRLAEAAGDSAFDRLFHGGEPDERAFARAAVSRGLGFLVPRPLPRPPLVGAENRRLAAVLAVAAELWLRLGRSPSQGQAFFRAARWADETGYDLAALAREGNLAVVAALDAASRALLEEAAGGGAPALVAELMRDYLAEEAG
jgi:hypothetical protein